LSILFIFSNTQLFVLLILLWSLVFISLIVAHIFIISLLLLVMGLTCFYIVPYLLYSFCFSFLLYCSVHALLVFKFAVDKSAVILMDLPVYVI
jgi:hypothetical protein